MYVRDRQRFAEKYAKAHLYDEVLSPPSGGVLLGGQSDSIEERRLALLQLARKQFDRRYSPRSPCPPSVGSGRPQLSHQEREEYGKTRRRLQADIINPEADDLGRLDEAKRFRSIQLLKELDAAHGRY